MSKLLLIGIKCWLFSMTRVMKNRITIWTTITSSTSM
ncbi:unnamed protein product [Schistosoma mattheei]|uniref:Uncharacterized protein n=1 Tax=Schistosoma mattheei TaxID=31246 RepID=A0A3P8I2T7_9TREM|nr:unnamed protein product [Schistosoma mattheei]